MTPDEYYRIQKKASKLVQHINDKMAGLAAGGGNLPEDWFRLHEWLQLANVIGQQAYREAKAARAAEEPATFTPEFRAWLESDPF